MSLALLCRSRQGMAVVLLSLLHLLFIIFIFLMVGIFSWFVHWGRLRVTYAEPFINDLSNYYKKLELNDTASYDKFDILKLFRPLIVGFMILCFLICLLVVFGTFAAWKFLRNALVIYEILILVLFSTYLSFFLIIERGRSRLSGLKISMEESISGSYHESCVDLDRKEECIFWNALMIHKQCCGIDKDRYFQKTRIWTKHRNITMGKITFTLASELPWPCCRKFVLDRIAWVIGEDIAKPNAFDTESHNAFFPNHPVVQLFECTNMNSSENNKDVSCYDALWDEFEPLTRHPIYLAFNYTFMAFISGIVLLCAILICLTQPKKPTQIRATRRVSNKRQSVSDGEN